MCDRGAIAGLGGYFVGWECRPMTPFEIIFKNHFAVALFDDFSIAFASGFFCQEPALTRSRSQKHGVVVERKLLPRNFPKRIGDVIFMSALRYFSMRSLAAFLQAASGSMPHNSF